MAAKKPRHLLSRQRLKQIELVKDGKCPICYKPLLHYKSRCDKCVVKDRKRKRESGGFNSHIGKSSNVYMAVPD